MNSYRIAGNRSKNFRSF